jgi:hypothetical protein
MSYQTGTIIDVQSGASVCADSVIMSGSFTGGGIFCNFFYTLNLTCIIQGFYNASTDLMVSDTVEILLRDYTSPYAIVDSDKAVLSSSGTGTFRFANAVNGANYYIEVTHRNMIKTWSNTVLMFTGGTSAYDFTSAAGQAFGNNMIQIDASPFRYAVFNGDVNRDGVVDATDALAIDNDASIFLTGYVSSDVNGDELVDASDALLVDNNASNFVSSVTP